MAGKFQGGYGEFAQLALDFWLWLTDWLAQCGEMWLWADFRETMRACFTAGQRSRHSVRPEKCAFGGFSIHVIFGLKIRFSRISPVNDANAGVHPVLGTSPPILLVSLSLCPLSHCTLCSHWCHSLSFLPLGWLVFIGEAP